MFLGDGVLWKIGEFRGVFETGMNWSMVRGSRWIVSQTMEFTNEVANGAGEEKVRLRSSSPASGLGTVIETVNFERRSLPRIIVGHLGSMSKEWENGVS